MSELAGKTLKQHYYLEKKLASGGFGAIYLAKDTFSAIGANYVIKHFAPSYENETQLKTAMRLFEQESDILQKLGKHSQIPRIYDFFEEDSNFFLVQEFIEGQTLQQELARSDCFDQSQATKLLTQTLEVLQFVHESGYIHRDIKPDNLIRNRFDRRIFLIDFGAVKEKINPQNIVGTEGKFLLTVGILSPGYTSDEQFHGRPQFCSDLYSLGMVVIQAMTGVHPNDLQRNGDLELIWRDFLNPHLVYDVNFLDSIDKMVKQRWEERYQSAQSILEDLEPIVAASNTGISRPFQFPTPQPIEEEDLTPELAAPTLIEEKPKTNKFKILASLGILSAIAIPVLLYLTNSRSQDYITYENEYIKIDYPKNWSRENTNFLNNTVVFISPKENETDEFQERIAIIVEESAKPISLKQYSGQAIAQIESLNNFIISPPRSTILGRSDAKYVLYQGMNRDTKVKRKEIWTVNYQQIYTVIYTAEPEKFDKFLPQAEKTIESLEIIK